MDFTNAFWTPFKELLSTVEYTIYHKRVDLVHEYQNLLKQHRTNFTRLLKFPSRNAKDRAEINRGPKEGTVLSANTPPKKLPASLVQEVLLLSDVLELNEFSSLELLLVGQDQTSRYAGWSRGLVATVLYHDGRRSLLTALKTILQAKQGPSWSISLPEEVNRFTQEFIAGLLDNGLVKQIFDQLRGIDVQTELSRLEQGGGVGDQRHRALLSSLISDQRQILSDCLLTLSFQDPLSKLSCLELLRYLREVPQVLGDGSLDGVSLSLLFSFIASVDVGHLLEKETGDELTLNEIFPVLSDPTFIPDVTEELRKEKEWKYKELKACVLFTWAQLLRICAPASPFSELQEVESDELMTDTAINLGLFRFLTNGVIGSEGFHNEELYLRKLHQLVTSFIVNMPLKIKEMATRTEEILRFYQSKHSPTREEDVDNISRDYQEFMLMIGALYGLDPLSLELSRDYWQVATATDGLSLPGYSRPSSKQTDLPGIIGTRGMNEGVDSQCFTEYCPKVQKTALFNFVRSCGEHLHPAMFTVYLTMLNGLSCGPTSAQHCFALLRAFSSYTGSYVSLDHLFNSMKQYAESFSRHGTGVQLHMTGVELEGMKAVLKLLTSLAYWDQTVRISLVEHPTWQTLHVLTSLVACPVPCGLKAEIFRLLANLNKTQEVGMITWQNLESLNIIGRPDSTSPHSSHGIALELKKIESRNETYPETRGFLRLLDELTNHPLPDKLQFSHYLDFLIQEVFLEIDKFTFEDPDEKWEMLSDVLQVLHKFVKNYSPDPSHTLTPGSVTQHSSPAAVILMKLLYDSPLLSQLLATLHAGYKILKAEENVRAAKSHFVDRACLLSLQLLEEGLEKGEEFRNLNQGSGSYALLSPLDSLLLGINPKTNRADHLLVITLFVTLQLFSPELSLTAVNILCLASNSSAVAKQLCPILIQDPLLTAEIMSGFVQRVEVEDWETYEESDILSKEDKSVTSSITSSQIRIRILQLILLNINTPAPNIAHLLLGFETKAPAKHTILQDPGIDDNPRTCLHSILYLISPPPTATNHFTCHSYAPRFSMLAYQVLHTLCSHSDLSTSTLRYLRSSKNFFHLQLQAVPFLQTAQSEAEARASNQLELALQHQQSWLLRMVAIELHLTTRRQQRSHTQKLISLLLSDEKAAPAKIPVKKDVKSFRAVEEEVILPPSASSRTLKKLSVILSKMDLSDVTPSRLELSYFKEDQILHLIQQHLAKSELFDMNVIDIKSLHRFINREMLTAQIAVSQKPHVFEEIRHVLSFALEQNQAREQMEIKKHLFESWNQMTDILLLSCPEELLPRETRFPLLLELAQLVLDKALSGDLIVEVIPPLTGSLLTIFSHLSLVHRQCLKDTAVSINIDTPTMKPLLASILDILSHPDRASHGTRINLYGVLLYYFQMCRRQVEESESQDIYMQENKGNSLESMTMSLLNAYGDSLIGVVCRDALDSINIAQTLSFSLLEQILVFDEDLHWLKTLSVQGYLRHMVDSIGKQDGELVESIRQGNSTADLLFYQAKISFLTRVAMCIRGPELLSQANLFYTLSNMSYIDLRPEVGILQPVSNSPNSKAIQTYTHLFQPTLRLLLTVLSSAAKRHYDIVFQVTHFVSSHSEVIFSILGSHTNTYTLEYLQEISLVTSLVSLSCAHYTHQSTAAEVEQETTSEPLKALCLRVQRLVLNLLPTYCLKSHTAKLLQQLKIPEGEEEERVKREALLYILQTANSILRYAVVTMNRDGLEIEMTTPKIMFNIDIASAGAAIHERAHLPTSTLSMGTLLQIINDQSNDLVEQFDNLNKSELLLYTHTIESSLYLFWRHLEFYLVFAYDRNVAVSGAGRYLGDPYQKLQTSSSGFIPEPKLNKFKQELHNLLTPAFFTQLQQVEEKLWVSEPGSLPQARFLDTTIQNVRKLVSQKTQGN